MTWLRKMRPVLIVLGLALAIGSMVGARALTHGGSGDASAKSPDTGPRPASGLYVIGFVDTDQPQVQCGLPPVLQSGTISKVFVKDGDEVKVDQPLYEFDTTIQTADLVRAKAGVATVKTKVEEAKQGVKEHAQHVKLAEQTVVFADRKVKLAFDYYTFVDKNLEKSYKADGKPPETWEELKKSSLDLYKAKVDYTTAVNEQDLAKLKVEQLKSVDPQVKVNEAEAAVKQAEAEQAKAQSAVDLCVVRAKTAGTVEQTTIGPGTTLGVGTRLPALWLIPAGPRVVRAEVEGEFAHRVGPELNGKTVTIYDHTDAKLTYTGTVRRVGTTFLPKRSNPDSFLGNDTRVLEVLIDVTDPAPAGKPPLYVGKRVRVNLGQ